jgi:hypothetical protein
MAQFDNGGIKIIGSKRPFAAYKVVEKRTRR